MRRPILVAGAASPPDYDVAVFIDLAQRLGPFDLPVAPVSNDLGAPLSATGTWPIRNQYARGTCNAFSIVAAEELWSHLNGVETPWMPLSEEFLYHHMLQVPLSDVVPDPDLVDEDEIAATGATFLKQAVFSLRDHGVCRANLMPYDPDYPLPHVAKEVPVEAVQDAQTRIPDFWL